MTGSRHPILVVDDDEQARVFLATALERDGYATATAADASEARALLTRSRFVLAICDLMMPGEPGHSLVSHICRAHPGTAVLIMSGSPDHSHAKRVAATHVYGYLVKPFGRDQFLITVANAVRRRDLELERAAYERTLEDAVRTRTLELRRSREETIRRLALAIESRDGATGCHSERTSLYAELIAKGVGLDAETRELITVATPLHDVGKIAIPDRILHKPGPLTPNERQVIQTHAEIGRRLLAGSGEETLELAATIAWTHHERLDGSGYPRGLRGQHVPLAGQIAAVADVFEALISERPYRPAFPLPRALEILSSQRSGQLDLELVDALVHAIDARSLDQTAPSPALDQHPRTLSRGDLGDGGTGAYLRRPDDHAPQRERQLNG